MVTVDAHQHFWDPATAHYPWMSEAVAPLCRRFGPEDLQPLLAESSIDVSIAVQARSDLAETGEFLDLALEHPFLVGVVGWVDLTAADLPDVLDELLAAPSGRFLVGVRHQVEDEPDPDWLLRSDVRRGLRAVADRALVYDLLVRPPNLDAARRVVGELPELRFVVDHIAKPLIAEGRLEPWDEHMRALAGHQNVWCKVSGLVTEADRANWTVADLVPYTSVVLDAFGAERLLFGSDWPVVTLAATYKEAVDSTLDALAGLSDAERERLMGGTAVDVYRLEGLLP